MAAGWILRHLCSFLGTLCSFFLLFYVQSIEWFTEDQACLRLSDSTPHTRIHPLQSSSCLSFSVFCESRVSQDREKAWPSINHSLFFSQRKFVLRYWSILTDKMILKTFNKCWMLRSQSTEHSAQIVQGDFIGRKPIQRLLELRIIRIYLYFSFQGGVHCPLCPVYVETDNCKL